MQIALTHMHAHMQHTHTHTLIGISEFSIGGGSANERVAKLTGGVAKIMVVFLSR